MATVGRVEAIWQNFIGAPGYSRFTFESPATTADATTITGKVRAFFNALITSLPAGVTIQVQQAVPIFDAQTGILFSEISASAQPALVTGTGIVTNGFVGGAGAFIGWRTSSIWQGRRVQGRTFMVPLVNQAESNGTLTSAAIASLQAAANGLIAPSTPAFGVWAKKYVVNADQSRTQVDGSFFLATAAVIPDKSGILKSRRD